MRLVFLPLYVRWWSEQTSSKLYLILLVLYILQLTNMGLYFYAYYNLPEDFISHTNVSEVLTPLGMMVLLCILHSQIVSPRSSGASRELTPFTKNHRRTKRIKRRSIRNVSEKPSSNETDRNGMLVESTSKFTKRPHLRKLSFEDGCRNRRRSVAWDTSPIKNNIVRYPADEDPMLQAEPNAQALNDGNGVKASGQQDDDGFESLNSVGSTEELVAADNNNALQEEKIKNNTPSQNSQPGPEAVFRNNWLEQSARRASIGLSQLSSGETDHKDSDSDNSTKGTSALSQSQHQRLLCRRRGSAQLPSLNVAVPGSSGNSINISANRGQTTGDGAGGDASSYNSSDEGETGSLCPPLTEGTTSAAEWIGITTNSDDCSVSSDIDEHPFASEFHMSPTTILSPSCAASDKVSCTMWEKREVKKAELSVLDISSAIIARVEAMPEHMNYFYAGMFVSVLLGLVPSICRLAESHYVPSLPDIICYGDFSKLIPYITDITGCAFGINKWETTIASVALLQRIALASLFFFLVAVAERTFKQRFLYAKFFSHLTSFRRARKSELPHFRLNKVRNIKTWLSVRSYLRKRGPQHSVDVIVSFVFLFTLLLLGFLAVEHLKDSERNNMQNHAEALVWCIILGFFLLRFMTLGTKINRKYRNLSVLITEQINLYLQIEQKPNKKEEL
uniref:Phtf-FEM1B_bdg domain-containing protein n=4 Tax=Rhodnius TaxID=13248 RepID=T1HJG4_RHOPR